MSYATLSAIRNGAGLLSRVKNETLSGVTDGSNVHYFTTKRPLAGSTDSDAVVVSDVVAFVDGSAVAVSAVDAKTGKITLTVAPASNTRVTLDYQFCVMTADELREFQCQADDWIDSGLKKVSATPLKGKPGTLATAAKLYASGLILIDDHGSSVDTDLTSKDGYKKITLAKKILADYIQGVLDDRDRNNTGGNSDTVSALGIEDVFSRDIADSGDLIGGVSTDDEFFMRRR